MRREQGSQNAVMGHREKNRDMHNEIGMPLWDMGRVIGMCLGKRDAVMGQREDNKEGNKLLEMW